MGRRHVSSRLRSEGGSIRNVLVTVLLLTGTVVIGASSLQADARTDSAWKRRLAEGERFWSFRKPVRPDIPGAPRPVVPLSRIASAAPDSGAAGESLEAWYRADSISLRDRSPVHIWTDQSGKGRHLVPTRSGFAESFGHPPRFIRHGPVHGHPSVRFGARSGLGSKATPIPRLEGDAAYTLIVVVYLEPQRVAQNHATLFGFGDPAPGKDFGVPTAGFVELHAASSVLSHSGGFGHNATLRPTSLRRISDRAVVLTVVKRPGPMASSTSFFVNGKPQAGLAPESTVRGSGEVPQMRIRADWSLFLGSAIRELAPFRGDVSEAILYSTALDAPKREAIEAGLVKKYGITLASHEAPHPIDAFIRDRLKKYGLSPAEPATRRCLIRRAWFDLLGLPPPPHRIERFIADREPFAWERLIDELLESPQYGERWGRHWLDVARYADTGGYETDIYFRNAWRYRDWVVKSFNDDKPYDRFVQEQIAGDELWPDNLDLDGSYVIDPEKTRSFEALTGTGLYALGPQIHESNMDAKKLTLERLTDWVDTTGSAFLGLTLGCARCHDHKFDPISQRDYYSLQAVFSQSREAEMPIQHGMGIADFKQHYPAIVRVDEARTAYRLFEKRSGGRKRTPDEEKELRRLKLALADAVLALPTKDAQGVAYDGIMERPTVTVLQHERKALVPQVRVLARGDPRAPRDIAPPALPELLARQTGTERALPSSTGSRTELAKWLTTPDHPLTARVIVNRIWQWHFGRGIVPTASDFGAMGVAPSHPELLDWLATEFVDRGWSIKAMHRLIMTSSTYRQSSRHWSEKHARIDSDNRLLWRMNRRRLEGEAVWDAIHSVAGTLNLKMGGRPVMPPLVAEELTNKASWIPSADPSQHTRRGLYIIVRRNFRFPLFETFDAPVNAVSCAGREASTVAPQALWLLNNPSAFGQAKHFAARVAREASKETTAQVERAFRLALGRAPTTEERAESVDLIAVLTGRAEAGPESGLVEFCLTLFNLSEFIHVD